MPVQNRDVKTLVLEQNHHTGGNMSGFRRKGFYFDGGDQSFESLGIVFPILDELGLLDKLRWHKARFRMVSPEFDFCVDSFEEVEGALQAAFPGGDRQYPYCSRRSGRSPALSRARWTPGVSPCCMIFPFPNSHQYCPGSRSFAAG